MFTIITRCYIPPTIRTTRIVYRRVFDKVKISFTRLKADSARLVKNPPFSLSGTKTFECAQIYFRWFIYVLEAWSTTLRQFTQVAWGF